MEKPPTSKEIEEWKKRGFDSETIRNTEHRLALFKKGQKLIPAIENAFTDVTLGEGVGLMETFALDDYSDEETRVKVRDNDEMEEWRCLIGTSLQGIPTFFFDAEGFRFHLPAFMCANLRGDIDTCYLAPVTASCSELSRRKDRIRLLNSDQKHVLRQYMEFLLEDPYEDVPEIRNALEELWP